MTPRLKSLELHGYKTFASRTVFEFPGDITAIVGPNGSGKSNIADAMRWVLGEQSFSLLRGRKTEDMIFAGSEQRARAGMASASITFDNQDGWLPIDFTEVAITRRAYRDGQNEYLLNGQRVRLKEISELLAQSGLAERTYTIIGQGLVDAALSLKPEERRRFFEEAAGIGLYRSRRDESLNRLETTRRNLERVQDILSELEPRLHSLERQARRVQEYERIKADLRMLLRDWYGYHWRLNQKEIAHTLEVLHAQESRLESARGNLSGIDARLADLRAKLMENRAALNEWHAQSAGLHTQREQISRKLAVLDERQRALQEQHQSLTADQGRLEEEHTQRQNRLNTAQDEFTHLQADLEDAEAQVQEALGNLNKRQSQRAQAERDLRETRRLLVDAETRQVQRKARHNELTNRREEQCRSQDSLRQAVESGKTALQNAQKKLEQAEERRKQAQDAQKQAEADLQAHQQRVQELDGQRRKAIEERSRREAERARLQAQLDVLDQAEKSLSGLNNGAKFVLQASRQGKLAGRYKALSNDLLVPREYEAAIAACLGESLDGVVLDERADLEHVMQLLESGEKGRAILFPPNGARTVEPLDCPQDADCVGVASELVQAPAELLPVVRLLLGQVVVVRSRAAARRVIQQLPASARAVTLRGEVFWGSGMVAAGQEGRTGVIARPRQMLELRETLAAAGDAISAAQEQVRQAESELSRLQEQGKALERDAKAAGQSFAQAAQAHQQAVLETQQVIQKQEWQAGQLSNLDGQLQRTDEEIGKVAAEMEKAEADISGLQEKVRQASRGLADLPLDELQSQVAHWNTQTAVINRAVKDVQGRLAEYRQALENNQRQQASLRQRLEETAGTLQRLEGERAEARAQEQALNQQIDVLRKEIEPAEQSLQVQEKEYANQQSNQLAAQQAATVAERYASQTQLELARQRETAASLRRRIEEDFGLVAFDYSGEEAGQSPLPLEGMVEELPVIETLSPEIDESINRQRAQLRRLGAVNFEAQSEYLSVKERYEFLSGQVIDLHKADTDLRQVISELDELMRREFRKTFDAVAAEFKVMFSRLFGGGSARLHMTDEENLNETGIDIEARLPGRREQALNLLSGGERSLTAVALVFSLLKVSPTPFCILDEVDAMLDEANVGRYRDLLNELSENTQFIVITHNRNTVQVADVIYGVTMGRDSASQIISLRLDEVSEEMVK